MKIDGTHYRSLWWNPEKNVLEIIDQRWLPHDFRVAPVATMQDFADAIYQMRVRGAPLIGATAAYGMALAMTEDPDWGGQGMPRSVAMGANDYLVGANLSFMMYPGLTHGAGKLVETFGTDKQKELFLKKMYTVIQ